MSKDILILEVLMKTNKCWKAIELMAPTTATATAMMMELKTDLRSKVLMATLKQDPQEEEVTLTTSMEEANLVETKTVKTTATINLTAMIKRKERPLTMEMTLITTETSQESKVPSQSKSQSQLPTVASTKINKKISQKTTVS